MFTSDVSDCIIVLFVDMKIRRSKENKENCIEAFVSFVE